MFELMLDKIPWRWARDAMADTPGAGLLSMTLDTERSRWFVQFGLIVQRRSRRDAHAEAPQSKRQNW
jgi:hypothetical protein